MELMELPLELLHIILVYAALGRGVKRALRLRLVCKTFVDMVHPALFETHLMDSSRFPVGTALWQLWNQHGADKLWHEYLVYRVVEEKDATVCQETENALNLRATVEALCWLVLKHGTRYENNFYDWGPIRMEQSKQKHKANLDLNLLSAAAHFDILPLAKRLLAEGHSPTSHNYLFAPPTQIAAQAGNIAILKLFQEQVPEPNFERWSVTGAAMRGDIDMLKLALRLDRGTRIRDGHGEDMKDQYFGSIGYATETG
jgi:hypothetical protein